MDNSKHERLEHDDGVELPPYVTRRTDTRKGHLVDDPNWMAAFRIFAARELPQYGRRLA